MHEVRSLNKHEVSTTGIYLAKIWDLGVGINLEENTAVSNREWANAIVQRKGTPFLDAIDLHSVEGHADHGEMIRNFVGQPGGLRLTPDEYINFLEGELSNSDKFITRLDAYPSDMVTFYTKEEAFKLNNKLTSTVSKVKNFLWELNDELDDLYVALYKAKDAYEYDNNLGGYRR